MNNKKQFSGSSDSHEPAGKNGNSPDNGLLIQPTLGGNGNASEADLSGPAPASPSEAQAPDPSGSNEVASPSPLPLESSASEATVLYFSPAAVQKTPLAPEFGFSPDSGAGAPREDTEDYLPGSLPVDTPVDETGTADTVGRPKPFVCQITGVPLSSIHLLNGRKLGRFIVNPYRDTADTVDTKGVILVRNGLTFRLIRPADGVLANDPVLHGNQIKAKVYMFPDEITERVIDAAVKLNNPACHFVDAAKLYSFLNRRAGLAQKDIMSWFNLAQSTLSNLLRLLALDSTVLKEARTHGLSERHCRALLHVDGTEMQLYVMNVMLDTKVGSQRAEQLVKPLIGKKVADLGKVKYIELINNAFCDIGGYLDKERKSFIASIVREVNALRKLGIPASIIKTEKDEYTELFVRIKKESAQIQKTVLSPSGGAADSN